MARRLFISSSANPRLRTLRRLARKGSPELCLAAGNRCVAAALAGARVHELYVAPHLAGALVRDAERAGVTVIEVDAAALPEGLVAIVERPAMSLEKLAVPASAFVAVAVGIERPGNLGTIVRTAAAAGVDALLVADPCTDLFHPDVVRGSVGSVFALQTAVASTSGARDWLREHELRQLATTPAGDSAYWEVDVDGPVALIFGSERHGLPDDWLHRADVRVAIPMPGNGDSLNVAVAAGVVLFDATRRRSS